MADLTNKPCFVSSFSISGASQVKPEVIAAIIAESGLLGVQTIGDLHLEAANSVNNILSHNVFTSASIQFKKPYERWSNEGEYHTVSALRQRPNSNMVDVNFVIHEKEKPRTLSAGATSDGTEPGFSAKFTHPNLNGGLEKFHFDYFRGLRRQTIQINLEKPVFNDPFIKGYKLNVHRFSEDYTKTSSFTQVNYGFSATMATKAGHTFSYVASLRDIQLDPNADSKIVLDGGLSLKSSVIHNWRYDTRDNPILPYAGVLIDIKHEFAGLGGSVRFIKQEVNNQLHVPLTENGLSLNLFSKLGFLFSLRNRSAVSDRFQLGGPLPLRGFERHTVGPIHNNDMLGGDVFYAKGALLTIPLPEYLPTDLKLHLFANCGSGSLWEGKNYMGSLKNLVRTTRVSTGVGISWACPVGRFELNYCFPLRKEASDRTKNWDFSLDVEF